MGNEASKKKRVKSTGEEVDDDPALKKSPTLIYSPEGGLVSKQENVRNNDGTYTLIKTDTVGLPLDSFFDKYDLTTEVLGKGSFAEVRLANVRDLAANPSMQSQVAVKIMEKDSMDARDLEDVRREVELLKNLDHINIVKVYDYYEDEGFVYVVMEYLQGGELYRNIDQLVDYTEKDTRDIMFTLISALSYCKDRGIAHRDIKPENILLRKRIVNKKKKVPTDKEGGLTVPKKLQESSFREAKRNYEIVLADFGFAIQVGRKDFAGNKMETQCGTPLFIAPEIIKQIKYNYKCDVWSLGIVAFMLLSGGQLPFPATAIDELYSKVLKCTWDFKPDSAWANVSELAKDFVRRCIVLEPKHRASYNELSNHRWFKDTGSKSSNSNDLSIVNFDAMKRFNAQRKLLKAIKAREAAATFKILMEDKDDPNESENLKKYKKIVRLTDFYSKPSNPTEAQKVSQEENKVEPSVPPRKESDFLRDVDDYV